MNDFEKKYDNLHKENKNDDCFKIIALGGDAKSKIQEALVMIKERNYAEVDQLLNDAAKNITQARNIQHKLLTKEIRDNNVMPSILLNHAMDILITAESEIGLVNFIYPCLKELEENISKRD